MAEVIVVGAGPVGLLMAAELDRRGVDVELLEQRAEPGRGSRAVGIHPPVLAALEDAGLTDQLLSHSLQVPRGQARSRGRLLGTVHFDRLSTRFPFVATLPQAATEQVLAYRAPAPQRGVEVTAVRPTRTGVQLETSAGPRSAGIVVLAGGPSSRGLVYRRPDAAAYPDRFLMSDVDVGERADSATAVVHLDQRGVLESFPLPGRRRRFVAWDPAADSAQPHQRTARLHEALVTRGEEPAGEASAFGVRRFVAPQMRNRGLFVIGDAAHEVSPIGGQGMNLGLLDAASLAPLLARWARTGVAPQAPLKQWEQDRSRSARRAAHLAGLNTRLGRPAPSAMDSLRRGGVRMMLGPGSGRLFARAYAMGFDTHA